MNKPRLEPHAELCAANLKRIWLAKKRELRLTQETAGARLGWTQGAVGQYINAYIPLNTDAKLRFAALLGVDVTEIDPDFAVPPSSIASAPNSTSIPILQWHDASLGGTESAAARAITWFTASNVSSRAFGLTVEGDSMADGPIPIRTGCLVIIDPERDLLSNKGPVVLARLPDGNIVLREVTRDGSKLYLRAYSPGFPMIPLDEDTEVLGVLHSVHYLRD